MRHDKIMTTPAITKYEGVRETVRFAKALRAGSRVYGCRAPRRSFCNNTGKTRVRIGRRLKLK
jgi:hypothetical protein